MTSLNPCTSADVILIYDEPHLILEHLTTSDNKVEELEENKEKVYKITYDFEFWYSSWFNKFYAFHHSLFTTGNAQYSNNKEPM